MINFYRGKKIISFWPDLCLSWKFQQQNICMLSWRWGEMLLQAIFGQFKELYVWKLGIVHRELDPSLYENLSHFWNGIQLGFFLPPSLLNGQMSPSGQFFFLEGFPIFVVILLLLILKIWNIVSFKVQFCYCIGIVLLHIKI